MAPVLLATCAALPDGDEDGPALLSALHARGIRARWCAWDDPSVDWSAGLVLLRSTWDYTLRRAEFLAWARAVPRLANPAEVVAWNSDKTYLREIDAAGVPITPTAWAAPGEVVALPAAGEYVVKPSVGAGSRGAGRFTAATGAAAETHARALHDAGRTVLVQPYLADVDTAGETALVYLNGRYSHAVRKGAMLAADAAYPVHGGALFVEENVTGRAASDAELAVGARVLDLLRARFGSDLLYTRVDLLPGPDGPVVVEVEVTEPSLFLSHAAGSADRFAAAIAARTRA